MVLMSRGPVPKERVELKTLCREFDERYKMKVNTLVDQIERTRKHVAQQDRLKRARLE